MPITIRNKQLEADLRELGRKMGKGPTDVIRELAAERKQRNEAAEAAAWEAEKLRRRRISAELAERARREVTDDIRRMIQEDMDAMYDENGLPR